MSNSSESVKTAVSKNQVLVTCPKCQFARMVPADKFPDRKREVGIKCKCGHSFKLSLEYRRQPRKITNLEGSFKLEAHPGGVGVSVKVTDLSLGGVGLEFQGEHSLKVGDKGTLHFKLDNAIQSSILELVVVRNINDHRVGCQFDDDKPFQKDLGFYLLG